MRLHRLSLTAFGPFAGTEEVDFDEVGRDGLFLLWGPTGAGKTTLLDAVVFALYGTVPGARGEEKRLRSDHAGAATRTEVSCELTLGGERLLVIRRPEQQRPKKRGEGWTTEQAKLTVQRLTEGGWEPVSTRIDEGSEHLRTRLGLDVAAVLPGRAAAAGRLRPVPAGRARAPRPSCCARCSTSTASPRAEDWLADERVRVPASAVAVQRARLSTLLARVAQVADVDVPEELAPELVGAGAGSRGRAVGRRRPRDGGDPAERRPRPRPRPLPPRRPRSTPSSPPPAPSPTGTPGATGRRAELDALTAPGAGARPAARRAGRRAPGRAAARRAGGRRPGRRWPPSRPPTRSTARRRAWAAVSDGRDGTRCRRPASCATRPPRPRALLPEVERAAGLEREIARAGPPDRRPRRGVQRPPWPRRTRGPRRLAEQERRVADAQAAEARVPGLRAAVRDGGGGPDGGAVGGAPRGCGSAARARTCRRRREAWSDARERWLDLRGQRARRHGGRARRPAGRRRRLPGLRRRPSIRGPPRTPGRWSPPTTSRPPARPPTRRRRRSPLPRRTSSARSASSSALRARAGDGAGRRAGRVARRAARGGGRRPPDWPRPSAPAAGAARRGCSPSGRRRPPGSPPTARNCGPARRSATPLAGGAGASSTDRLADARGRRRRPGRRGWPG